MVQTADKLKLTLKLYRFVLPLIIVGICGQTELVTLEYGINPVLLVIFIKGILL